MAKTTIVRLVDDTDGTDAHETVKFGIDGLSYEIDLSNKNAAQLRHTMNLYTTAGTRIRQGAASTRAAASRPKTSVTAAAPIARPAAPVAAPVPPPVLTRTDADVRKWALEKGLPGVPRRGRISGKLFEAYDKAHGRR